MTPAERKARSRANALGEVLGQIALAEEALERLSATLEMYLRAGPAFPGDVRDDLDQVEAHLEAARLAVPRS